MKALALFVAVLLIGIGCQRDDMWDQPKSKVLGPSDFFAENQAARMPVEGTVSRGNLKSDDLLYRGTESGEDASRFPFAINKDVLIQGRGRYDIFCSPCHGKSGDGLGMIVQRGFKQPPSLHEGRLRSASAGKLYRVIVEGIVPATPWTEGAQREDMVHPPIGKRLTPEERWAIVAFIRALQLSQSVPVDSLSESEREQLNAPNEEEAENHG